MTDRRCPYPDCQGQVIVGPSASRFMAYCINDTCNSRGPLRPTKAEALAAFCGEQKQGGKHKMGEHLIDGEFQSDKYPTCPKGKVPLSTEDKAAQDLLWEYAKRRRSVDPAFSDDLEEALRLKGYYGDSEQKYVVVYRPLPGEDTEIEYLQEFLPLWTSVRIEDAKLFDLTDAIAAAHKRPIVTQLLLSASIHPITEKPSETVRVLGKPI